MCWCTPGISDRDCDNPWCGPPTPTPEPAAVMTLLERIEGLLLLLREREAAAQAVRHKSFGGEWDAGRAAALTSVIEDLERALQEEEP